MRIFRVRGEVVDLIAIGASSCLVQEFLRRRQRRATAAPSSGARWRQAAMARSWYKLLKNPPKITFKKFVKLTGYTYACTSLTNFEYKAETEVM